MGSAPPLLGILIRPRARPRHTLENILATGEYTLNHIHPEFLSQAHQTSAHYPREISEFQATGLKALYREGISAPFVLDSRVQISMKLREHLPIALNGTELVIGEVTGIWALHSALDLQEGLIQLTETQSVAVGGLDQYYGLERLSRFQYAKPELPPRTK
jgi:flavin reductase (DIM6/NTAB) family NADH-FMN oxidoreductase RutF